MAGLSTAWFLQERGVRVSVFDQAWPGAGASWGNAGWITPTLTTPLPEPGLVPRAVRGMLRPGSPLFIPPTVDPALAAFLARFARNTTAARWSAGVRAFARINRLALGAYDVLTAGGVDCPLREAEPFVLAFADTGGLRDEIAAADRLAALGQPVDIEPVPADRARALAPMLTGRVHAAALLHGQRFLDPPAYVAALARAVRDRGGTIHDDVHVASVRELGGRVELTGTDGAIGSADAAVIATGAALPALARHHGVRLRMRAGRGYSFAVAPDDPPVGPVYFPGAAVVCTPLGQRMRIAGMMEFRRHGAPLDPRRIDAIAAAVRPLLRGVDLDDRADEWVGSRPCTVDGLPLIGRTRTPQVYVAGGHAMEGMTLGPATGRLLAESIVTGTVPAAIAPFDPLR